VRQASGALAAEGRENASASRERKRQRPAALQDADATSGAPRRGGACGVRQASGALAAQGRENVSPPRERKRQRPAALQDADATSGHHGVAEPLECARPLALWLRRGVRMFHRHARESGRGLPHSKTLTRLRGRHGIAEPEICADSRPRLRGECPTRRSRRP